MSREERDGDKELPFWDHVVELSRRLRIVFYTFIIATVAIMALPADTSFLQNPFFYYDPLVAFILRSIKNQILPPNVKLIGYEMAAPLELYLVASLVFGFALTTPVMAHQIYKFLDPALYPAERRAVYPFVASFTTLFALGVIFGYVVLAPFMISAMLPFFSAVGAEPVIYVMDFYNVVFVATAMCGLVFTFPAFFVLLVRFGILHTSMISGNRLYIYAALYIATAWITPDGGPVGDTLLFAPAVGLLEAAILVARRYEKKGELPRRLLGPSTRATKRCGFCGSETSIYTVWCQSCGRSQV